MSHINGHWTSKGYVTADNKKIRSYIAFMNDINLLYDFYSYLIIYFTNFY